MLQLDRLYDPVFFFTHDKTPKWSLSLYNATVLRYENCLCLKNRSCWNQFCLVWFGFCLNCPPRWSSLVWKFCSRCLPPHWTAHNGLCFLWVPQRIFSKLKGTVSRDCRPFLFKWILYWHHINKQKIIAKFFDFAKILQIELCILIWRKQNRSQTVCEEAR